MKVRISMISRKAGKREEGFMPEVLMHFNYIRYFWSIRYGNFQIISHVRALLPLFPNSKDTFRHTWRIIDINSQLSRFPSN